MPRRTKAAERAAKYRERRKQQIAPQDLAERIAGLRSLVTQDVPEDLLRDYLKISDALDEELAGGRRSRQIQELSGAKTRLAEQLQLTPRERRLSGEQPEELLSAAIARSVENARKVMAARWTDMQEEIWLIGRKEDLGGQTRADFIRMIADLRLAAPKLFDPTEMEMPAEGLLDRVLAARPARFDHIATQAEPSATPPAEDSDMPL